MSGRKIETHIIEPKNTAIGSVIWLHGLGADNRNFESLVPLLTEQGKLSLRFVFPNAPIRPVTINQHMKMRAWYDIYSLAHLDQEDVEGITDSQAIVEELIALENKRSIPTNRIILAGFSQGGAIALHTGLRHQTQLAGILALSCYLPLFRQVDTVLAENNKKTPIFIAHGQSDPVLPLAAVKMTHAALEETHHNLEWHEYKMAHEVCMEEITDIQKWLSGIFLD